MPLYIVRYQNQVPQKYKVKYRKKYKVTVENMICDKAISRVDGVKIIPLATLKDMKKQRKKLNFR